MYTYIYIYTHACVYIYIYVYILLSVIVFFSSLSFYGEWTISSTKRQPAILNLIDGVFLISSHGPGLSTSSHASFEPVEPRFSTGTSSPCAEAASLLERRISCLDGEKVDHF